MLLEERVIPSKYSPVQHLWNVLTGIAYLDAYRVIISTNVGLFINKNASDSEGFYELESLNPGLTTEYQDITALHLRRFERDLHICPINRRPL